MSDYQSMIRFVERFHDRFKRFCNPLVHHFGINEFIYQKQTISGKLIGINYHLDRVNHYFSEGLYLLDPATTHPDNHQEGIVLIHDIEEKSAKSLVEKSKTEFGVHFSLALNNKTSDGMEFYIFGLTSSDFSQKMKLYNEISLLRLFIKRFKEEFGSLILKLNEYSVDMIKLKGALFQKSFNLYPKPIERLQFLEHIGLEMPKSLTPKEIEIVKHVVNGLSASKIADLLSISPRTVEHHLERIKDKFDCLTKAELIQKIRQIDEAGCLALF